MVVQALNHRNSVQKVLFIGSSLTGKTKIANELDDAPIVYLNGNHLNGSNFDLGLDGSNFNILNQNLGVDIHPYYLNNTKFNIYDCSNSYKGTNYLAHYKGASIAFIFTHDMNENIQNHVNDVLRSTDNNDCVIYHVCDATKESIVDTLRNHTVI